MTIACVVTFPRHKYKRCTTPDCVNNCPMCAGLSWCEVCGGAEGSLPTDCPGERMHDVVEKAVYAGEIDYRFGRGWIQEPNYPRLWQRQGTNGE